MTYVSHFKHADDVIAHLNGMMPSLTNPLLIAKYTGFTTVAAVTVYEMAIKHIFIEFARKKHKVLLTFTESYFSRINGKIKIDVLKSEYIPRFGKKYLKSFEKHLQGQTASHMLAVRRDIKTSYGNLILWRNDFTHGANISVNATYSEVAQAYEDGKKVISCLDLAMRR